MKRKQSDQGFKHGSPIPFPTTITSSLSTPVNSPLPNQTKVKRCKILSRKLYGLNSMLDRTWRLTLVIFIFSPEQVFFSRFRHLNTSVLNSISLKYAFSLTNFVFKKFFSMPVYTLGLNSPSDFQTKINLFHYDTFITIHYFFEVPNSHRPFSWPWNTLTVSCIWHSTISEGEAPLLKI